MEASLAGQDSGGRTPLIECPELKRLAHLRAAFESPLLEVFGTPVLLLSQLRASECCICCTSCCCCGIGFNLSSSETDRSADTGIDCSVQTETPEAATAPTALCSKKRACPSDENQIDKVNEDAFCLILSELSPSVLESIRTFNNALQAEAANLSAFATATAKECSACCHCVESRGVDLCVSSDCLLRKKVSSRNEVLTATQQYIQVIVQQRLLLRMPDPDGGPTGTPEMYVFASDWLLMLWRRIRLFQRKAQRELAAILQPETTEAEGNACTVNVPSGKKKPSLQKKLEMIISADNRRLLCLPAVLGPQLVSLFNRVILLMQREGALEERVILAAFEGFFAEWEARRKDAGTRLGEAILCLDTSEGDTKTATFFQREFARTAPLLTLGEAEVFLRLRKTHRQTLLKKNPSNLSEKDKKTLRLRQLLSEAETLRSMLHPPSWLGVKAKGDKTYSSSCSPRGIFCCEVSRRLFGSESTNPSLCVLCREKNTTFSNFKSASSALLQILQSLGLLVSLALSNEILEKRQALSFPCRGLLLRWLNDGVEEIQRLLSSVERNELPIQRFLNYSLRRCGLGRRFLLLHLVGSDRIGISRDSTNSLCVMHLR